MKKDEMQIPDFSAERPGLPPRPAKDASRDQWRTYAEHMAAVAAASEHRASVLQSTLNRIISSPAWKFLKSAHGILDAVPFRGRAKKISASMAQQSTPATVRGTPLVSILIPFRDQPALLSNCLSSIREKNSYAQFEIVLIDNGSIQKATAALLQRESRQAGVQVLRIDEPFNFSRLINAGAKKSSGEHLLLLNNDVEALAPGWMEALLEQSQKTDVGAVGAKLLYPDGRVQHAGIVVGLSDVAGHIYRLAPADDPCCNAVREFPAVTGACLMTRRALFDELGGLNERDLPVSYNDVDYCLRVRERGLRVVYTPHAVLLHHESVSRGRANDPREAAYICRRWPKAFESVKEFNR